MYAYATYAGLSVLIPVLIIDGQFEKFFRNRILSTIAEYRNCELEWAIIKELRKSKMKDDSWFITRTARLFSHKVLYFLTIRDASDKISYYWHQAFLVDYMLSMGHLKSKVSAQSARQAMEQVLNAITTSPLHKLAEQIIPGTRHILSSLREVRQGNEDRVILEKKAQMEQDWPDFEEYLKTLAEDYKQTYQELITDSN